MLNNLFKFNKTTAQEQFWQWFSARSSAYFDFENNQESLFDELSAALNKVQTGLVFEFGPKENETRDFIISADGDRKLFLSVTQLVKAAPCLKQWNVLAFRQRHSTELEIGLNEVTISPTQVYFKVEPDGDKVGITLIYDNCRNVDETSLGIASYLFLDGALGEYDVETKVGFVDRKHLDECKDFGLLQPFRELPITFDKLYTNIHN